MISSKNELHEYLMADKIALKRNRKKPKYTDLIWKFQIALRRCEYYQNCSKSFFGYMLKYYYKYKLFRLGTKCNFTIPLNVIDKGLSIAHVGPIVINSGAKIGRNCRIHVGVNIGTAAGEESSAPTIGNEVYIGPGAKLFGQIKIADGIAIGANSVVNKSFEEKNISIAGVPAKKISDKGSKGLL